MERFLEGRAGVVTGAGRGIGRGVAHILARYGARVVVNDYGVSVSGTDPSDTPAKEVADEIAAAGGTAVASAGDVASWEYAEELINTCIREFGRIDFLVTCAGILRDRMMFNMTEEEFDAVVRVHLKGTFACGHFAGMAMRQQRSGAIITFSSGAQEGNMGQSNYSAAKGGIASMTYTWALELRKYGVRANSIVPVALTRMVATIPDAQGDPGRPTAASIAAEPEDVGHVVAFLASDAAAAITGQVLGITRNRVSIWQHPREKAVAIKDGGWTADDLHANFNDLFSGHLEPYGLRVRRYLPPEGPGSA